MNKIDPARLKVGDLVSPRLDDYRLVTHTYIDNIGKDVHAVDVDTGRERLLCLCQAKEVSYVPAAELPF